MRYNTDNKERRYVQGYGFLSFARDLGKRAGDSLVKSAKDSGKTIAKRALAKTSEATGDFIGQKIADKITKPKTSKKSRAKVTQSDLDTIYEDQDQIQSQRQVQLTPQQRQKIIEELKLISEV